MPDVAGLYWNAAKGLSWMQVAIIAWSCFCLRVTPWSRPRREWKNLRIALCFLKFLDVSCRSASWQRSIIQTLRETLVSWPCMNINDVKQTHGCSHVVRMFFNRIHSCMICSASWGQIGSHLPGRVEGANFAGMDIKRKNQSIIVNQSSYIIIHPRQPTTCDRQSEMAVKLPMTLAWH